MKLSLVSLSFAALVTAGVAVADTTSSEESKMDRNLPTYPELGLVGADRVLLADGYRFNAGESTHDLVVQDVGSA